MLAADLQGMQQPELNHSAEVSRQLVQGGVALTSSQGLEALRGTHTACWPTHSTAQAGIQDRLPRTFLKVVTQVPTSAAASSIGRCCAQ